LNQVISPVNWVGVAFELKNLHVSKIYEIGSSDVVVNMIQKTTKFEEAIKINSTHNLGYL